MTAWQLKIHGMVDREITYRFEDLERFEAVEKVVTLTCVSNPVGGDLISNASWTGYRVRDLLADAGIHPDADMVLSTSIDGFTAGTPVEALTDGRDALLAIGMNGQPLPTEHGYPARLVVPGLYGYVSATKWVVDLELTRFDRAEAYWTRLGWSPRGPIKTESRIDVPRSGQDVARGPVTFGGVAWAQHRGVQGRRGPHRQPESARRLAAGPARRELLQRHLAAVELPVAGRPSGSHTISGASHRQHRRRADGARGPTRPRRRQRLAPPFAVKYASPPRVTRRTSTRRKSQALHLAAAAGDV